MADSSFPVFASDTLISFSDIDSFSIDNGIWAGGAIVPQNRRLNA
jgi:hypothetical protein